MAIKLKQIPILLEIIKKYESDKNAKPIISYVEKTFNSLPIEETTYPDFNKLEKFCNITNILKSHDGVIEITNLGTKILKNFRQVNRFDSNTKKILRENCFLKGFFFKSVNDGLLKFIKTGDEVWSPIDKVYDLFSEKTIISLLYECDLLSIQGDKVILNPMCLDYDKIKNSEHVQLSQKQIDSKLELMKKIGNIAENIVLNFEKNRLKNAGLNCESDKVQRISLGFANAGYDVVSFNGSSPSGKFDRFIEVKGSSSTDLSFYWSEHEKDVATKLKEKYWIYFISEINVESGISSQDPVMIQNPALSLFSNSDYTIKPDGYHVAKKL